MIKSGGKVKMQKTDEGLVITILPNSSSWQRMALNVWTLLWMALGVMTFVVGSQDATNDQSVYLFVFGAFWLYFLFYAVRSLIWLNYGVEYIRIGNESVDYKRSWKGYGTAKSFDLGTIRKLGWINYEKKSFAKSYGEVFWTIGGETIGFEYIGQKVAFGLKLNDEDAKDIIQHITKAQSSLKSAN